MICVLQTIPATDLYRKYYLWKEQEIYFQMNLPKSMADRNNAIGMNLKYC